MKGVNKVILIGTLGKDPEVKFLSSGDAVCNLSIATTESWKDKTTGEKKEKTEWHNLVFFKRLAEIAGEYLRKGSKVYVEGKLQTRKWQDKDGNDRYTTEIKCHDLQMLDSKSDNNTQQQAPQPKKRPPQQRAQQPQQYQPQQGVQGQGQSQQPQAGQQQQAVDVNGDWDDDIPF